MSDNCRKSCGICKPCESKRSSPINIRAPPVSAKTNEQQGNQGELPSQSGDPTSIDGLPDELPDELLALLNGGESQIGFPAAAIQVTTTSPPSTTRKMTTTMEMEGFDPYDNTLPGFHPPGLPINPYYNQNRPQNPMNGQHITNGKTSDFEIIKNKKTMMSMAHKPSMESAENQNSTESKYQGNGKIKFQIRYYYFMNLLKNYLLFK